MRIGSMTMLKTAALAWTMVAFLAAPSPRSADPTMVSHRRIGERMMYGIRYIMHSSSMSPAPMSSMAGMENIAASTDPTIANRIPSIIEEPAILLACLWSPFPRWNAIPAVTPVPMPNPAHIRRP